MIIKLTNADDGLPIYILKAQVFYYRPSKSLKTVIVASVGGAFAPVRETEEQIASLLRAQEEPKNGTN